MVVMMKIQGKNSIKLKQKSLHLLTDDEPYAIKKPALKDQFFLCLNSR